MFGERLKLARRKAGFSLRGLSDALDRSVTAQSIGKYERGEMMPNSKILIQMSKALNVSIPYLMSRRISKLKDIEFRRTSGVTEREKAQVEAAVIEKLERYMNIEEILDVGDESCLLRKINGGFLGLEEDGEALAEEMRKRWELGTGPIPDMTALLENHGIKILLIALPKKVSGLTCLAHSPYRKQPVPAIIVNKNMTLERRRFTLGHELAHRLIDPDSPANKEKGANVFAGAFLVPRNHLVRQVGNRRKAFCFKEISRLKRMYRISAATLLVRLNQAGIMDKSALAYAFQTYARGWKLSEPHPLEPDEKKGEYEAPHRFERLCYWALAEKLIGPSKACELLQRPLRDVKLGMKGPNDR